jgi:rhamnulokinase
VSLETVHRFPNGVQESDGGLRWDFTALFAEVLTGLAAAAASAAAHGERIASIGIDTWAVDYGRVNAAGELVAQPFSYRDGRSRSAVAGVHWRLDPERLYATTGLQFLDFNTIYQLAGEADLDGVQTLLIPDLIAFLLTGQRRTEVTNASTTGLFDAVAGEWATEFLTALKLPLDLFPPLVQPGETIGTLLPAIAGQTGLPAGTRVVAVGSHDTASAVVAVPAETEDFAYISSGTWSLVGVELKNPVLTEASRLANFTNERGVDGTIRYLRNVGGLWLLSECQRTWAGACRFPDGAAGRRSGVAGRGTPGQRRRSGLHGPGQHARTDPPCRA